MASSRTRRSPQLNCSVFQFTVASICSLRVAPLSAEEQGGGASVGPNGEESVSGVTICTSGQNDRTASLLSVCRYHRNSRQLKLYFLTLVKVAELTPNPLALIHAKSSRGA